MSNDLPNELSNESHTKMDGLNEQALRLILQSAPIAIVAVDATGKILFVNDKLCELFQYAPDELIGEQMELLLPEALRALHVVHRQHFLKTPYVRPMGSGMDLSGRRKDGSIFPLEAGLSPIHVDSHQVILSTIIDITQRKQTEEVLEQRVIARTQEIEHRRRIADSMRDILSKLNANLSLQETLQYIVNQTESLLDADGSAIFLFDSASHAYKIRVKQGLSQIDVAQLTIPYTSDSLLKHGLNTRQAISIADLRNESLGQDSVAQYHRQLLLNNGYYALIVVPLMVSDESYGGLVTYYKGERELIQEELDLAMLFGSQISLAIQNANLRTRSEEQAVTAERNRIARDLHDSVTQTLFSASMIADVLPILWNMRRDEGERRLQELRELTRGALAEMRTLLLELRPATLEDVPLPELLQQLIDGVAARGKLTVDFTVDGEYDLPIDVRVAFFRTAQEAMNNVAKHAQATTVAISLSCRTVQRDQPADTIILTIVDDGRGFVLDKIPPNHIGLDIMRERAAAIGGKLSITTAPAMGTTVKLSWQRRAE